MSPKKSRVRSRRSCRERQGKQTASVVSPPPRCVFVRRCSLNSPFTSVCGKRLRVPPFLAPEITGNHRVFSRTVTEVMFRTSGLVLLTDAPAEASSNKAFIFAEIACPKIKPSPCERSEERHLIPWLNLFPRFSSNSRFFVEQSHSRRGGGVEDVIVRLKFHAVAVPRRPQTAVVNKEF